MKKRILPLAFLLCLLVGLLPIDVSAMTPAFSHSTAYKNSSYYTKLIAVSLTADGASNMAAIASSQTGYHEGNSTSEYGGGNTSGKGNYCEYNYNVTGYNSTSSWCATFIYWCAVQAGETKAISKTAYVPYMYNNVINAGGTVVSASSAKAGDLVFYKYNGSYVHVGIMLNSTETAEGNYSDCVKRNTPGKFMYSSSASVKNGRVTPVYVRPNYSGPSVVSPTNVKVSTNKSTYILDETAIITASAAGAKTGTLTISKSGTNILTKSSFTGGTFTYLPTGTGEYSISFSTSNSAGTTKAKYTFTVSDGGKKSQSKPVGFSASAPTHTGASDGSISGTTVNMEYCKTVDFKNAISCTEGSITGLQAGTYYIRYKSTSTHNASAAVSITVPVGSCVSSHLKDIPLNGWYHTAVDYCVLNGYMSGNSKTTFAPNANLTRAEIVQVLYNMENSPSTTIENPFTDVSSNKWYYNAVLWAKEVGISDGTSETTFSPNAHATREQVVYMLRDYIVLKGGDLSALADLSGFSDCSKISSWAYEAIQWGVACGVISGTSTTTISPASTTTRAQFAQMIYNYFGK